MRKFLIVIAAAVLSATLGACASTAASGQGTVTTHYKSDCIAPELAGNCPL